eukprot:355827-Chlamydomonas_euryale.AAC.7
MGHRSAEEHARVHCGARLVTWTARAFLTVLPMQRRCTMQRRRALGSPAGRAAATPMRSRPEGIGSNGTQLRWGRCCTEQ